MMGCQTPSNPNESTSETSRSLLVSLRQDGQQGWDRLVQLYSPLVYRWCRNMGLPEQDAADVFQEIFRAVALNIHDFRHERPGDTFRGWLRTVTRSKVYDHYRRRAHEPQAVGGTDAQIRFSRLADNASDDDGSRDRGAQADDDAERALLHRALELAQKSVEERTWKAFWLVVVEGRSPREAGEQLSMRAGSVRVAKSRVLHRLRQELGDVE